MTTATPDPAAELADLRAQVATLQRINRWLRDDLKALGKRRDTIRDQAQREMVRAMGER